MTWSRKRIPTLVGIEPQRVPESPPPPSFDPASNLPPPLRRATVPYGVDRGWGGGRDPSLFGLFLADGTGFGPAHRTTALGRPFNGSFFLTRGRGAPVASSPPTDELLPRVGSVLEKFRLDELLGVGGFAAVYRATHLLLKREVAVKLLRPSVLERKPELRSLLPREAELAARLDHPNVVRMIDVFQGESGTFLVMEYVDGKSLASLLRRRALPPARVVEIGIDVVRGLRAGQEKGLIHRDIKPGNIMVTQSGAAKVVDFGLALCFSEVDPRARAQIVGTRGYVAPEQVVDPRRVDFRSDIFSLGATLYHAVVGAAPFKADDSDSGLSSPRNALVPPQRVDPSVPATLSRLLTMMLSPDQESRPASYDVLEQALERARAEMGNPKGARG